MCLFLCVLEYMCVCVCVRYPKMLYKLSRQRSHIQEGLSLLGNRTKDITSSDLSLLLVFL